MIRTLASHPRGPRSMPARFSGFSKFQCDKDRGPAHKPAKADAALFMNIEVYLI